MAGMYLEQFQLQQTFDHEIRRTVTEADNVWFCGATYNPAQIHIDHDYCRQTEFGQPLINSIFTLGLIIGLIETFWSAYFSIEYKDVAAFSILIVVLIFLPTGILGRPEVEKV